MNSEEVAKILQIEIQEFRKIEESVAKVLHLGQSDGGGYYYSPEHLQALKEVFLNPDLDQNGVNFLFDGPEDRVSSNSMQANEKEKERTRTPVNSNSEGQRRQKLPLNKKKEKPVLHKELDSLNTQFEPEPFTEESNIVSALGAFERLSRDVDGTPIPAEEVQEVVNPRQILSDPRTRGLFHLIQEQKREFESRIQSIQSGDLYALKEENYFLKKQNRALQKEIETLENIIRNQNEDKKVLIRKLNEKFSLKNLFNWHSNESKVFVGDLLR